MRLNIGVPSTTVRSLAAVISVIMIFGITLGLTIPLIAIVLASQGHSSGAIGLHASVQFLGIMLASPITPRLLIAVGASRLMILSMIAMALIFFTFTVFTGFMPWLLLRLLLGGVEGIIFISAETWINQVVPTARRGRSIGIYGTLLAVGVATGPLLLELTGVEGAVPFLTGGVITIIPLVILLFALNIAPHVRKSSRRSSWKMAKTIPVAVASVMLFGFLDAAAFGLLPIYGLSLDFSPLASARLVTCLILGAVVFQYPLGWLADHTDYRRLLVTCAAIAATAMLTTPLTSDLAVLFYGSIFITGGMIGGFWIIPLVVFGENFKGYELASINSTAAILYGMGSVVGPSLLGFAMIVSPHGLMVAMAGPTIVLVFFGITQLPRPPRSA